MKIRAMYKQYLLMTTGLTSNFPGSRMGSKILFAFEMNKRRLDAETQEQNSHD